MAWITPKTNWNRNDYFNAEDYNRIKGNLEYLQNEFKVIYPNIELEPMIDEQVANDTRANTFSLLPKNLYLLNRQSFNYPMIENKEYKGNELAPDYREWNRIENYIQVLYDTFFKGYLYIIPRLPVKLTTDKKPF